MADRIFNSELWRRLFGRYEILDPRPMRAEHPYTFFLPTAGEIDRLQPGDLVKLMFSDLSTDERGVERMWVEMTQRSADHWIGKLDNTPLDMPQLKLGQRVGFRPWQIIQVAPERRSGDGPREYWQRCYVDPLVLSSERRIHYLERVEPLPLREGDKDFDSGWRIFGSGSHAGGMSFEPDMRYVALGVALNVDDGWLPLIDEPVGSAFRRDPAGNGFIAI